MSRKIFPLNTNPTPEPCFFFSFFFLFIPNLNKKQVLGTNYNDNNGSSSTQYSTTVNPTRNGNTIGNPGGTTPSLTLSSSSSSSNGNAGASGSGASGFPAAGAGVMGIGAGSGCLCNNGNIMTTGPTTTTTVLLGAKVAGNAGTVGGLAGIGGGTINEDGTLSNAETLLSSNARFQAISAIAVAQDGVINVADQGECFFFIISFSFVKCR